MKPRWYQTEAVEQTWQQLCMMPGAPVIVLPTGSGKSLTMAMLAQKAIELDGRIMVVAHRKELLEQNAQAIETYIPDADIGMYSAGLKSRDTDHQIVFAGIQSCYERAFEFGERNLILIDEVHLVPEKGQGMYRTFLNGIREANPTIRLVGLTATPYRMDAGSICGADDDKIFDFVSYEAPLRQLIEEGYLCNLTNRHAVETVDTSGLRIRAGEYVQFDMENLFQQNVKPACKEIIAACENRQSILIFSSGIKHADKIGDIICDLTGDRVGVVVGDTPYLERATLLGQFKRSELRWLVNCDVLTTGFDAQCIDAIAVLRATQSAGLFAQIVGRGLRIHPAKTDCLILDFGGNIQRHGPLDSPDYGRQKKGTGQTEEGEIATKVCEHCEAEIPAQCVWCPECGEMVAEERQPNHEGNADKDGKLLSEPERWQVTEINWSRHTKRGAPEGHPDTLRVDYCCQPIDESKRGNISEKWISEWVCIEHAQGSFPHGKAAYWWKQRCVEEIPDTIDEAIDLWNRGAIADCTGITTEQDGRWNRVVEWELGELPTEWLDESATVPFDDDFDEDDIPF